MERASEEDISKLVTAFGWLPDEALNLYRHPELMIATPVVRLMSIPEVLTMRSELELVEVPKVGKTAWLWQHNRNPNNAQCPRLYCGIHVDGPLKGWLSVLDECVLQDGPWIFLSYRSVNSFLGHLTGPGTELPTIQMFEKSAIGVDIPTLTPDLNYDDIDWNLAQQLRELAQTEHDAERRLFLADSSVRLTPFDESYELVQMFEYSDLSGVVLEKRKYDRCLLELAEISLKGSAFRQALSHLFFLDSTLANETLSKLKEQLAGPERVKAFAQLELKRLGLLAREVDYGDPVIVRVIHKDSQLVRAQVEKTYTAKRGIRPSLLGKEIEFVGPGGWSRSDLKNGDRALVCISSCSGKLYQGQIEFLLQDLDGEPSAIFRSDGFSIPETLQRSAKPGPSSLHTALRFHVLEEYLVDIIRKVTAVQDWLTKRTEIG